jgi:hypothetical protein
MQIGVQRPAAGNPRLFNMQMFYFRALMSQYGQKCTAQPSPSGQST